MKVKFKKLHSSAVLPSYAKNGDAGLDITCVGKSDNGEMIIYNTGIAVEVPESYVGLLFPRSSVCKTNLTLANCVGVLDSSYRGEIRYVFRKNDSVQSSYDVGDRVGQMIILPYPHIEPEFVDDLSITDRGDKGFGSTGK